MITVDETERLPDICVYLVGRHSKKRVPQRIPDLIVESVSESRSDQERDDVHKRGESHTAGVREYVFVDRTLRQVLVCTWQPEDYAGVKLSASNVYVTPLLPGLRVPLTETFAEI